MLKQDTNDKSSEKSSGSDEVVQTERAIVWFYRFPNSTTGFRESKPRKDWVRD